LRPTDCLTGEELSKDQLSELLERAAWMKANPLGSKVLERRTVALIFQRHSTRTRVSFETGIVELGGHPMVLRTEDTQLARGESIRDTAYVLSRNVAAIGIRTGPDELVQELAEYASVPVINMLTAGHHPCQAFADFLTLKETFGELEGLKLAYVGDGNNVSHSLIYLAARLGVHLRIATPANYAPDADVVTDSRRVAKETKARIELFTDPREAVEDVQAVYTDSWTSMGFEAEEKVRSEVFKPYQVNRKLMALAERGAVFMHCLPAHRGYEVTPEILDGPQSVVLDQSENRMYVQKAILHTLFR
jgi:ornithine carbamoyltransferase